MKGFRLIRSAVIDVQVGGDRSEVGGSSKKLRTSKLKRKQRGGGGSNMGLGEVVGKKKY